MIPSIETEFRFLFTLTRYLEVSDTIFGIGPRSWYSFTKIVFRALFRFKKGPASAISLVLTNCSNWRDMRNRCWWTYWALTKYVSVIEHSPRRWSHPNYTVCHFLLDKWRIACVHWGFRMQRQQRCLLMFWCLKVNVSKLRLGYISL